MSSHVFGPGPEGRSRGSLSGARPLILAVALLAVACTESGSADRSDEAAASPLPDDRVEALDRLVGGSPDGVVAFHSTGGGGIFLADPRTGRAEFLTEGFSPEWSADGGTLSFMRKGRIYLLVDGWGERQLPIAPFPFEPPYQVRAVLSPDGDRIAYSRYGGIVLSDLAGGEASYLTPPSADDDQMPTWSSDGRRLAFVRRGDVHVVDVEGSGVKNLTRDGADNLDPEWSPEGDRIAYSSGRGGERRIWTIGPDGSDRRAVTGPAENGERRDYHPSWSPDGSRIAFEGWEGGSRESAEIYVVEVDGGRVRRITERPGFDGRPSWGAGPTVDSRRSRAGLSGPGPRRRSGA